MEALQDAHRRLGAIRAGLEQSNPELYRHLALYLQVLRDALLNAIQQACFHLATQIEPERYANLSARQRRQWHLRMADLARRAKTLLTVEQVAAMAAQMARLRQRQAQEERARFQDSLAQEPGRTESGTPEGSSRSGRSIELGLEPPIDLQRLGSSGPDLTGLLQGLGPGSGAGFNPGFSPDVRPEPAHQNSIEPSPPEPAPSEPAPAEQPPADAGPAQSLQAMLQAFSEALETERPEGPAPTDADAGGSDGHGGAAGPPWQQADREQDARHPWSGSRLPTDPIDLLIWLEGYENALSRRLRNLSHALNVDGLRLGVTPGLLPVGLLDAALQGEVDVLPAPPNLLRLQVPAEENGSGPSIVLAAVLLRLADLELENPRLRTCRQRLQQHGLEVRRMAQRYRRVQRRVRILEAEQLWLEDNRESTGRPPPGNP
ncbi:hypothetical protein [Cyanobium sp. LEGE 06113]|uniref:hypothetical protein n=1 Tax=Cyanobium sp. LEGE 06113 TaxID=1297573 RepID=UPI00188146A4|nr:hypothetical protein [Cyanobium sp. LEGE 06113]MBE9153532.1 hypothetical protein [Cyanobium sp. LEGE 06113]